MKRQEGRAIILGFVLLVCAGSACRPIAPPPLSAANLQSKSSAPIASKPATCMVDAAELAGLNRQIARLSKVVVSAKADLHALTASPSYRGARECRGKCEQDPTGASEAAQRMINVTERNCQSLLQSLTALEQLRSDLIEACPGHFKSPAASRIKSCRE